MRAFILRFLISAILSSYIFLTCWNFGEAAKDIDAFLYIISIFDNHASETAFSPDISFIVLPEKILAKALTNIDESILDDASIMNSEISSIVFGTGNAFIRFAMLISVLLALIS